MAQPVWQELYTADTVQDDSAICYTYSCCNYKYKKWPFNRPPKKVKFELDPSVINIDNASFVKQFNLIDPTCKEDIFLQAVSVGNLKIVETLIELGVSVHGNEYNNRHCFNESKMQMSPIMTAAHYGVLPCLELLIQKGADIDSIDKFGMTPMHFAAEKGHLECLQTLIEAGANGNAATKYSMKIKNAPFACGTTPLHVATMNNHLNCILELLKACVDFNAVDEDGVSALYIAARSGYEDSVLALLDHSLGRKILSLPCNVSNNTPLHYAVKGNMQRATRKLLQCGSDVNHQNSSGSTPLHVCLSNSRIKNEDGLEILKMLVFYGYNTDINIKDFRGYTALKYVAFNFDIPNRSEVIRFLIGYGAVIDSFNAYSLLICGYFKSLEDETVFNACLNAMEKFPHLNNFTHINTFPRNRVTEGTHANDEQEHPNQGILHVYPHYIGRVQNAQRKRSGGITEPTKEEVFKKHKAYSEMSQTFRNLKHLCRLNIRKCMGYKRLRYVNRLGLPRPLQSYLVLGAELPES